MKKLLLILIGTAGITIAKAQYNSVNDDNNNTERGFKKENIFVGGSVSLGFGSGSFAVGGNPEIGYSFGNYFDAGLAFNVNYFSQRDFNNSYKYSSFNYGAGVFGRVWPLPFLFAQVQPEINWITYTEKFTNSNLTSRNTVSAASLIAAVGYGQHVVRQASFFFMVGIDLLNDSYSPYRNNGQVMPIIRGGFDVYLRPARRSAPSGLQL